MLLLPISAVAFALPSPSLSAAFSTPIFTPGVTIALLIECAFWAGGCALLLKFSRPLAAVESDQSRNAEAAPHIFRATGMQAMLDEQPRFGLPQPLAESRIQARDRDGL